MFLRRALLFITLGVICSVQCLTYKSADISSLLAEEAAGKKYKDTDGTTLKLDTLLAKHGMNLARIRVWTAGQYSTTKVLAIAARVHAAGMKVYLNMHYSDTWADPGHQTIPSGWPTDLDGLTTQIYTYTAGVLTQFASAGIPVEMISLGNEITNGLLWPVGSTSSSDGFAAASQLLHSAASAVRATSPKTLIMTHLDNGWNPYALTWYQNMFLEGGFVLSDVDIMAQTFYPFWGSGATFDAFNSTLNALISTYGKNVMTVETNWPVSCPNFTLSVTDIPVSVAGQQTWIQDLKSLLDGVGGGGKALGISYWEPGWLDSPSLGSACKDNLLFDSTGKARASVNIFSLMQ